MIASILHQIGKYVHKIVRRCLALAGAVAMGLACNVAAADGLTIHAAGSLRTAFDELIATHQRNGGPQFKAVYGPSGKLREQIEAGTAPTVFASAAKEHTDALAAAGRLRKSTEFTHNSLCLIARTGIALSPALLLDLMLDPTKRLGTSTPKADPMGDYTWELFRAADKVHPGAYAILDSKALQLTGREMTGPLARSPYARVFDDDRADLFVAYCTNAAAVAKEFPTLAWARFTPDLNNRGTYGIGVAVTLDAAAAAEGERFVALVLSPEGQRILGKYGFD
ncbi:MAG: extracellular solute-binding protein [Betaproteobacteria bacterium]